MHNEFEHEDDDWRPERPLFFRILNKAAVVLAICFIFGLIIFTSVRLITSYPPSSMKKLIWNESAYAAYTESENGLIVTYYPSTDSFSDDNMFSISQITYIEEIGQFQATVRYNERVLNYLCEDYGIESVPEGEVYIFMLRDNNGRLYKDYSYTEDHKSGYVYRHVIFDGVTMEDVTKIVLEAYYINDVSENGLRAELYMYRYDYSGQSYYYDAPAGIDGGIKSMPSYTEKFTEDGGEAEQ